MKNTRSFIFILVTLFTATAFQKEAGVVPLSSEINSPRELGNSPASADFANEPADNVIIRVLYRDGASTAGVTTFCTGAGTLTRLVTLHDEGLESSGPVKSTFQKARINEVLISYLAKGYEIESTENGPREDGQGVFMTYFLRRI